MVKKQYCDFCGVEIDFELNFEITIYDHAKDDFEYKKDICEKCEKKFLEIIKNA